MSHIKTWKERKGLLNTEPFRAFIGIEWEMQAEIDELRAALAQPAEPLIVKGALTGVVDQVIKAAFPTAQPEPVSISDDEIKAASKECFDDPAEELGFITGARWALAAAKGGAV